MKEPAWTTFARALRREATEFAKHTITRAASGAAKEARDLVRRKARELDAALERAQDVAERKTRIRDDDRAR